MIAKAIRYFGQPCILVCDAKCNKAWGYERPHFYLGEPGQPVHGWGHIMEYPKDDAIELDDFVFLSDDELPDAPADNGWYEGGEGKPTCDSERLNKWCARNCERSIIVDDNEDFTLPDFSARRYNIPREHEADTP